MRAVALLVFSIVTQAVGAAPAADPAYKPLWAYQGTWELTRKSQAAGAKPDKLVNECALLGRFFACEQRVNGGRGVLLLIIAGDQPGHYYTQTIMAEGRAGGRDDLEIAGDHWTWSSRRQDQPGKITYYRTTNVFVAKNRIHYEQAESADGKQWMAKDSGDEVRVSPAMSMAAH